MLNQIKITTILFHLLTGKNHNKFINYFHLSVIFFMDLATHLGGT